MELLPHWNMLLDAIWIYVPEPWSLAFDPRINFCFFHFEERAVLLCQQEDKKALAGGETQKPGKQSGHCLTTPQAALESEKSRGVCWDATETSSTVSSRTLRARQASYGCTEYKTSQVAIPVWKQMWGKVTLCGQEYWNSGFEILGSKWRNFLSSFAKNFLGDWHPQWLSCSCLAFWPQITSFLLCFYHSVSYDFSFNPLLSLDLGSLYCNVFYISFSS